MNTRISRHLLAGLLLASVFSWYYIFIKVFTFKRAVKQRLC